MNYNETKEYIERYIKARVPVIIINTIEKNRVLRMLKTIADEIQIDFNLFRMSQGIIDLKTKNVISDEKTIISALDFVSEEVKHKEKYNFIFSNVSDITEVNNTSRFFADVIEKSEEKSGTIIIITNEKVWSGISRLGITITLNPPYEQEIEEIIKKFVEPYRHKLEITWTDNEFKKAANYLQGLTEMEIKNIIASELISGKLTEDSLIQIKNAKKNSLNKIPGLEAIEVEPNLTIAGLENLKNWLMEKRNLLNPEYKTELQKRNIRSPRGILLTGVPGCGKSLCSKATAQIFNLPLYRLDLATVQGQYVGQSEQQLKEALETAEYVSPCVLWIDEIEKGFKEGSSNVTSKLIGQFLFWMQECKKDVFVVASSNSIDNLPPEMVRKGRFDEIFFVDLPSREERKELISIYFKKYLQIEANPESMDRLVEVTKDFASADIEATIRSISYKKIVNPEYQITLDNIINELSKVYSITKTNPEKINSIREWGKTRAIPASKKDLN